MQAILEQTQAADVNIQESACSSMAQTFQTMAAMESEELLTTKLLPLVLPILNSFTAVVDRLRGAALISMFDCVGTLAEVLGQRLQSQQVVDVLMPLLSRKWQTLDDSDKQLLPLFECFEQVIAVLGEDFLTLHIQPIYERCTRVLQGVLTAVRADPRDGWAQKDALFLRA